MTILRSHPPSVKPAIPVRHCQRCRGSGYDPARGGPDPLPCRLCDGIGMVSFVEPAASIYLACSADAIVDTGTRLEGFVKQLLADWPGLVNEDVALWRAGTNEDHGPRLVAVIRPGPAGRPVVQYL